MNATMATYEQTPPTDEARALPRSAAVLAAKVTRLPAGGRVTDAAARGLRKRQARLSGAFAGVLLAALLIAPSTFALPADGNGNYTQLLCANPASEEGLGIEGMPEGLSNPASIDTWQVTTSEVDCASGRMTPNRGVPMSVGQGNSYPQGTWSALLYEAPANASINGGRIYRAERAEGANNGFMGINQQGGEYSNLYSLPRNNVDQGDWFAGNISSRGTFSWAFSPENAFNLTISPDQRHWDVNATCDPNGNNDSSCTLNTGQWEYRIYGGEISLNASKDPQASNISGPMTTENPLHGNESVTFSATDEGPGLAYVKLIVDGNIIESQTIDPNNGHCIPVAGRDAYTWAYEVPCKTSVGGRTYTLNTALVADGSHRVQVVIEDAAGNQSIVVDRTVETSNAPTAMTPPGGPATPPVAPLASPVGAAAVFGAAEEAANGTGASSQAQLLIDGPHAITRSFAKRAITASGRLLNDSGQPIGDATLDVLEQSAPGGPVGVIGHASTSAEGTFRADIQAGPSRTITFAYRSHTGEAGYTTQASISERVHAGVALAVSPRRASSTGTITLSGHVSGPIPAGGVVVELLVRYRGQWEPFRTPRTNRDGAFRLTYRFQGAVGRFPFRAQVPASQADFPYGEGASNTVTVQTH